MTVSLTYPASGRGAWSKVGGTLNLAGDGPGPFFRAPKVDDPTKRIGYDVARAVRSSTTTSVSVDDYAVYRAVRAIQNQLTRIGYDVGGVDGVWGPKVDAVVKTWQESKNIRSDGIYGQQTARTMWEPFVVQEVAKRSVFMEYLDPTVQSMISAHFTLESGWDLAAVGRVNSKDIGLLQVNLDAHTDLTVDAATEPISMVSWAFNFVVGNLNYCGWNISDAIACYNAGRGGASTWVRDGRPAGRIAEYIRMVRSNMEGM